MIHLYWKTEAGVEACSCGEWDGAGGYNGFIKHWKAEKQGPVGYTRSEIDLYAPHQWVRSTCLDCGQVVGSSALGYLMEGVTRSLVDVARDLTRMEKEHTEDYHE